MKVLVLATTTLLWVPLAARAEIHDYMILRLLYLNTSCGVQHLERLAPNAPDVRQFHAKCRDAASFPHGVDVLCTDIADDRSCKVQTVPQSFDSLELLRPNAE